MAGTQTKTILPVDDDPDDATLIEPAPGRAGWGVAARGRAPGAARRVRTQPNASGLAAGSTQAAT